MPGARQPDRGDIWHLDFTPSTGKEMLGKHFAFVISPKAFNQRGLTYVAPITTGGNLARSQGLSVTLSGTGMKTTGVIDLTQIRAVDMGARHGVYIESSVDAVVCDVFDRIYPIFTDD